MSRSTTSGPTTSYGYASPLPGHSHGGGGSSSQGPGMGGEDGSNPNQPRVKMEGFDMPPSASRSISSPSPYATSFPSSYRPSSIGAGSGGGSASYSGGGGSHGGFNDDLLDMITFGGGGMGMGNLGGGGGLGSYGIGMGAGSRSNLGLSTGQEEYRGSREGTIAMEDGSGVSGAGGSGSGISGGGPSGRNGSFSGDFANLGFAMDPNSPANLQTHQHRSPASQQFHQSHSTHQQSPYQQHTPQSHQSQASMFQYKPVQGNPYDFFASPAMNEHDGSGGADPHAILGGGTGTGGEGNGQGVDMDLDLTSFGGPRESAFFDDPIALGLGLGLGGHGHAPGQGQFGAASSAPAGLYNPGAGGPSASGNNNTHPFEANGIGAENGNGGFRFNHLPTETTLPGGPGLVGGPHGFSLNAPSHVQQLQQLRLMQIQQAGMPFRRNLMSGGVPSGGNVKAENSSGSPSSLDGISIGNFGNQNNGHPSGGGGGGHHRQGSAAFSGGAFGHSLPVGGSPFSSRDTSTVGSSMTLSQGGLSFNSVLADLMNGANAQSVVSGGGQSHSQQQAPHSLGGAPGGGIRPVQPNPSMCLREYQALLRGHGLNANEAISVMSSTQVSTPSSTEDGGQPSQQQQVLPQQSPRVSSYKGNMGAPVTPTLNGSPSLPAHQRSGSIARRSASRARGEKATGGPATGTAGKRGPRASFSGTDTARPSMQQARQVSTTNVNSGMEAGSNVGGQRESSVGPQRRKPLKRGLSNNNLDGSPKVNLANGVFSGPSSGPSDTAVNAARAALNNASSGIMSPQSLQRFLGQAGQDGMNPASRSSLSTGPTTSHDSPSSHTTPSSGELEDPAAQVAGPSGQMYASGGSRAPPSAVPLRVIKTERSYSLDSVGSMRPSFRRVGSELGDGNMETVDEDVIEDDDADDKPIRTLTTEELAQARKSRRRLSHNEVERKRRETINEKIVELEQLLPPHVVATALAATQIETIKEEEEDAEEEVQVVGKNGKKATSKTRGKKPVKKPVVPERLCKGTVLCLTVDLINQMQEIMRMKDAREQELLSQIYSMQAQFGQGATAANGFFDPSQFSNDAFGQTNELHSIGDYGSNFGLMDMEDRQTHGTGDDRGRTRGR